MWSELVYPKKHLQLPMSGSQMPCSEHSTLSLSPLVVSATLILPAPPCSDATSDVSAGKSPSSDLKVTAMPTPGLAAHAAVPELKGDEGMRCNNCPSKGCYACPMFSIGESPIYLKRKAEAAERKRKRLEKKRKEENGASSANL